MVVTTSFHNCIFSLHVTFYSQFIDHVTLNLFIDCFRYGLERNYNSTTIFTLHLAFIDLCFCVICIPQYTFAYISEQWPFGEFICKWSGPIIFLITFVDWICLGFIALSRCLNMTKPKMWNNFCNKKTNVAIILVGMWALSALMTLPSFLEVFASLIKVTKAYLSILWQIKC